MIIESLNGTHFLVDGRRFPRAYAVQPYDPDDAFLAALAPTGKSFAVPLGSQVDGDTPVDQDELIDALAPIVTGGGAGGSAGGGSALAATLTNVAAATSSTPLLAANPSRGGVIIHHDSASIGLLAYADAVSETSHTVKLYPGDQWVMPAPIYKGAMSMIWLSAVGAARITELS